MEESQRKVFGEHLTFLTVTEQAKDRLKEEKIGEINDKLAISSRKAMARLSQKIFATGARNATRLLNLHRRQKIVTRNSKMKIVKQTEFCELVPSWNEGNLYGVYVC